jgi:hypothetical protein
MVQGCIEALSVESQRSHGRSIGIAFSATGLFKDLIEGTISLAARGQAQEKEGVAVLYDLYRSFRRGVRYVPHVLLCWYRRCYCVE